MDHAACSPGHARPAGGAPTAGARCWLRPALGLYLFTAFLVCLTIGKVGAYVNYFVEFAGVVGACAAVTLADAFAQLTERQERPGSPIGPGLVVVLLPVLLLLPFAGLSPRSPVDRVTIPSPSRRHITSEILAMVRATHGAVLADDMTLLVLAGKRVEFQPFEMTQLTYSGLWDESGIVDRVAQGWFDLIILPFDVNRSPPNWEHFSPRVIAAIRRRYVPRVTFTGAWAYVPR